MEQAVHLGSGLPSKNAGKKSSALPQAGFTEMLSSSKWVAPPYRTTDYYRSLVILLKIAQDRCL